jgi:hypothetical protein
MLFPAQHRGAERRAVVLLGRQWRRQAARLAECHQIGAVGLGAGTGGIEAEMDDPRRH